MASVDLVGGWRCGLEQDIQAVLVHHEFCSTCTNYTADRPISSQSSPRGATIVQFLQISVNSARTSPGRLSTPNGRPAKGLARHRAAPSLAAHEHAGTLPAPAPTSKTLVRYIFTNSTRRFSWRPSAVVFDAIGLLEP